MRFGISTGHGGIETVSWPFGLLPLYYAQCFQLGFGSFLVSRIASVVGVPGFVGHSCFCETF